MDFIISNVDLTVVALCAIIGFLWKHTTPLANGFIPVAVTLIGILLECLIVGFANVTVDVVLTGAMSGLVSTALHQLITRTLDTISNAEIKDLTGKE